MEPHATDFRRDLLGRRFDNETQKQSIEALEQRIIELEAENTCLAEAARAFGELAERLNALLQQRRGATTGVSLRRAYDRRA